MWAEALPAAGEVDAYLRAHDAKELLRLVVIGSVDDGKSTLIGRLLVDSGAVYEDQLDEAERRAIADAEAVELAEAAAASEASSEGAPTA